MGPAAVDTAPVTTGKIELSRPLVATVQATVRSVLAAEEAGLVAERMFDEGERVKKDAVLVRLKTDLMQTQVTALEAAVKALHSQIDQAAAELDRARLEVERMAPVIEQKAAPQKEMDNAQRDLRVTAAIKANREAMLAEKQAELERTKLMIAKSEVRSPIDAVVAARHVEVGEWIKQGDPIAEIVQLDPLFVRANVPESLVAQLHEGDTVNVSIDALPNQKFEGKIAQILPEADMGSRTFGVKILLANPDHVIRPGFFARATFLASTEEGVFLIPKDALVNRESAAFVAVAREGKAVVLPVQVVNIAGQLVSVRGELNANDLVITKGNETLRGGEQLMMKPPGGGPPATQKGS